VIGSLSGRMKALLMSRPGGVGFRISDLGRGHGLGMRVKGSGF
jgi:N-acetylglucosamine kinase-like BadF-type ATPase